MKKTIIVIITCVCIAASANAQQGSGRLSLGTGLLYKNGMDVVRLNTAHMEIAALLTGSGAQKFRGGDFARLFITKEPHNTETRGTHPTPPAE